MQVQEKKVRKMDEERRREEAHEDGCSFMFFTVFTKVSMI